MVTNRYYAIEIPMTGELLNDEPELVDHPWYPFEPSTTYRVRYSLQGREVIGPWDAVVVENSRAKATAQFRAISRWLLRRKGK